MTNDYEPCIGCMWNCGQWCKRPSYGEPKMEGHCQKPDGNFTYMTDEYCPYSNKESFRIAEIALLELSQLNLKTYEEEMKCANQLYSHTGNK